MLTIVLLILLATSDAHSPAQRCYRAVENDRMRAYLILRSNQTYERIEVEGPRLLWLDRGAWSDVSRSHFRLTSDRDAWSLQTRKIYVSPYLLKNVPLLRDLKATVLYFLSLHPRDSTFSYDQVRTLEALGDPCPYADSYVCRGPCDGPWLYGVNTQPQLIWPEEPVTRDDLLEIAREIDSYLSRSDLNVFDAHLLEASGVRVVRFERNGTGLAFRAASEREIRQELERPSFIRDADDKSPNTSSLVEVPCSSVQSEVASFLPPL